jgi:NAD(P)H-flavin reductase
MNETGLTVRLKTKPGWYLGVSSPGAVEEDAYTMASPDEFVVLEVDHRNYNNYTERALETLVREVLLPADVDGVLGLL